MPVPLAVGDASRFEQITLPIYDEDDADKAETLRQALEHADVVVVASRRGYGALARQPERYAETLAWYQTLLTTREVIVFTRCPRLGPIAITDDPLRDAGLRGAPGLAERCGTPYALRLPRLDESTRVYDAPVTLVFLR